MSESSKQDRQAARTAADLEYRYKFGKSFAEAMGVAEDARETAQEASDAAAAAQKSIEGLDQTAIFNLLTNNGKAQGVFMDENGEIYINASYLAAGIIRSVDGAVKMDLGSNKLEIEIPPSTYFARQTKIVFDGYGMSGYGDGDQDDGLHLAQTMALMPAPYTAYPLDSAGWCTRLFAFDADLLLDAQSPTFPAVKRAVRVGQEGSTVKILGKTVKWKANSDGTYTLIGSDE